jgi:hypothetical protein
MCEFYCVLVSVLTLSAWGTLTIRYASLRNSSAVAVDGGRGSPLGIVVLACLSLRSRLISEVMSVIFGLIPPVTGLTGIVMSCSWKGSDKR